MSPPLIAPPEKESIPLTKTPIIYPESDGKPMADNTEQFKWIVLIKENLEILFAEDENVFVAGDLLWYPVEDNNRLRQAPDALVVFGRPKGKRGSYKQWEEGNIPPQVVFEIISPGNRAGQMQKKLKFYRRYGVEEYYIYDPDRVILKGYVRDRRGTLRVKPKMNNWVSPRLGIRFSLEPELVIYQPNGQRFLTTLELESDRRQTEELLHQTEVRLSNTEERLSQTEREKLETETRLTQTEREKLETETRLTQTEREKLELEQLLASYRERFGDLSTNK